MSHKTEKNVRDSNAPGCSGRFAVDEEFAELASAVSALTADELAGLTDSLSATDGWDTEATGGHCGGGILANQF
jgi:hypothetical protein